jgi:hypothetical protein
MFTAIHGGLLRRMLREFRKRAIRTGQPTAFTMSRQMMMAAEYLGQAMGLLPDEEYEFGDFLMRAVGAAKQAAQRPIHLEAGADLRRMGEELQKLDKAFLVLLICERIKSFFAGRWQSGRAGVCFRFFGGSLPQRSFYICSNRPTRIICISRPLFWVLTKGKKSFKIEIEKACIKGRSANRMPKQYNGGFNL